MATNEDVLDKLDDVLDKINDNKEKLAELEVKMDEDKSVQRLCWHCGGDGEKVIGSGTGTCPDCGGDGVVPFGRITKKTEE